MVRDTALFALLFVGTLVAAAVLALQLLVHRPAFEPHFEQLPLHASRVPACSAADSAYTPEDGSCRFTGALEIPSGITGVEQGVTEAVVANLCAARADCAAYSVRVDMAYGEAVPASAAYGAPLYTLYTHAALAEGLVDTTRESREGSGGPLTRRTTTYVKV